MRLLSELDHPLATPRLRLEPVTARLAKRATEGPQALADVLDAEIPQAWVSSGFSLAVRRPTEFRPWRTIRAIVIHRADRRVVGDVRFEPMPYPPQTYEVGYAIIPSYRRQGLASEAMATVVAHLFEERSAARIIAGCDRRNRASIACLRRLGFWLDGARGDAFWWELTPEMVKTPPA